MAEAKRLHSIEAMRGLAALSVAWFHLTNGYPADGVRASGSLGWLGVDAFFVISGFVIPYSLDAAGYRLADFPRFIARRMVRLEPPYLVSIGLALVLYFASAHAPMFHGPAIAYSWPQVLSHLLYLVPLTPFAWIQPVYWSLAYEFIFYIFAGLAFTVLWKRHILLIAAAAAAALAAKWAIVGHPDGRILLFFLGAATARHRIGRDGLATLLICLASGTLAISACGQAASGLVGLATALTIAFARLPQWRPLLWLGSISYSLYLVHVPIGGRVVNLGRRFGGGSGYELLLSLTALAISMTFAWLFCVVVERTATRWSRRIGVHAATELAAVKHPA